MRAELALPPAGPGGPAHPPMPPEPLISSPPPAGPCAHADRPALLGSPGGARKTARGRPGSAGRRAGLGCPVPGRRGVQGALPGRLALPGSLTLRSLPTESPDEHLAAGGGETQRARVSAGRQGAGGAGPGPGGGRRTRRGEPRASGPTSGRATCGQKLMATACCSVAMAEVTCGGGGGGKRPTRWPSSACCTISRSYLTISWMMAFSWLLNTPELRSCWTLCSRMEFFLPGGGAGASAGCSPGACASAARASRSGSAGTGHLFCPSRAHTAACTASGCQRLLGTASVHHAPARTYLPAVADTHRAPFAHLRPESERPLCTTGMYGAPAV